MFDINNFGLAMSSSSYKAGFNFNTEYNTFYVDFYNKDYKIVNNIPLSIMYKFKTLINNIPYYNFYKQCLYCKMYDCTTNSFNLDLKSTSIPDLKIKHEFFGACHPLSDGYRLYKLENNYIDNYSHITYKKTNNINYSKNNWHNACKLKTHLIKFDNISELVPKLNKTVIFS